MTDTDCEQCVSLRQEAIDSDACYWRVRRQLRDVLRMVDLLRHGGTLAEPEDRRFREIRREIEILGHMHDEPANDNR